jgi:hypothetical protein
VTRASQSTCVLLVAGAVACSSRSSDVSESATEPTWHLSTGAAVKLGDIDAIVSDFAPANDELDHLLIRLRLPIPECQMNTSARCVRFGSDVLVGCARGWLDILKQKVVVAGSAAPGTTIRVRDAYDRLHETVVPQDGEYELTVHPGAEPAETLVVRAPFTKGGGEELLWLHVPLINRYTNGMAILRDGDTWFASQLEPDAPALRAGIQAGDTILSLDGESVAGKVPGQLRKHLGTRSSAPMVIGFSRCGPPRTVTVQRVPNAILLARQCCVEERCPRGPAPDAVQKPRTCSPN